MRVLRCCSTLLVRHVRAWFPGRAQLAERSRTEPFFGDRIDDVKAREQQSRTDAMSALNDKALFPAGALAPGHRLDRYEILAKLASGGMAIVYVANAQGLAGFERLVALKVLHANLAYEDEFIRMFLDEARLAARIRHPHVVSTIDVSDSIETGFFLVMEYIEGDHLGALLAAAHKAGMRIGLPVILRVIADALAGLGAAHALTDDAGRPLHLVHRDVSPHNVLVGCDGVARLTDFGVAKAEDRLTHTRDGQIKGKLAYMAPEQASNGVSDQRSDLFSMGIILWECVTGRRLFRAESTAATLHKLLSEEIAPPSAIDPALAPLDALLRRALDRDPSARFQTADEFIEALEGVARGPFAMAPRRAVSEAVKLHAATKLARERALIGAAKRALQSGDVPAAESGGEAAQAEVSLTSLSRSKPSGVFSNRTAPGLLLRRARSSSRPAARGPLQLPQPYRALLSGVAQAPVPPPPLGSVLADQVPEPPLDRVWPSSNRPRVFALGAGLLIALSLAGWLLMHLDAGERARATRDASMRPTLVSGRIDAVTPQAAASAEDVATPAPGASPVSTAAPSAADDAAPAPKNAPRRTPAPAVAAAEPSPPRAEPVQDAPAAATPADESDTTLEDAPKAAASAADDDDEAPAPVKRAPRPARRAVAAPVAPQPSDLLPNPYSQ
jgi:serine/threonine-protein kinase